MPRRRGGRKNKKSEGEGSGSGVGAGSGAGAGSGGGGGSGAGAGTGASSVADLPTVSRRHYVEKAGMRFVESLEGEDVQAAWEALVAIRASDKPGEGVGSTAEIAAHVAVLEAHPFVRQMTPQDATRNDHTFVITGYSLFINRFRKWLKSPGRAWFKTCGGVSDDGLYTMSPLLRELMPRGFHVVEGTHTATGNKTTVLFTGIRKFSGLGAQDEDEESNADATQFLFDGKTMTDVTSFFRTAKSNGENAKFILRMFDGVPFLISGSKNTCNLWPADEPSTKFYSTNSSFPAPHIADHISRWYLGLHAKRGAFVEDALKVGSIMGEINRAYSEHLIPIHESFLENYSVLGRDGKSLHPAESLAFFTKHGLPHVPMEEHPVAEMKSVIATIREDAESEGSVLYLLDKEGAVVGLVKVKSNHYVIVRRARESFKAKVLRVYRGALKDEVPVDVKEVTEAIDTRLRKGMRDLSHVPGCDEHWEEWYTTTTAFAQWWLALASKPDADIPAMMREAEEKFASLYHRFLKDTGNSLFGTGTVNPAVWDPTVTASIGLDAGDVAEESKGK